MPIADVDADSQTRTLLDIGDGPLSIVFEMLSTPGVGICSVARGRPRWISGDEDSDATVAESEDDLDIEAESEEDEAADDVAPGQVGGAAAPRVATKRVTILKLISQLMELAIRTMRELIRMQFAF